LPDVEAFGVYPEHDRDTATADDSLVLNLVRVDRLRADDTGPPCTLPSPDFIGSRNESFAFKLLKQGAKVVVASRRRPW